MERIHAQRILFALDVQLGQVLRLERDFPGGLAVGRCADERVSVNLFGLFLEARSQVDGIADDLEMMRPAVGVGLITLR